MMPLLTLSDGKSVPCSGLGGGPGHTEDTENPGWGVVQRPSLPSMLCCFSRWKGVLL